MSGNGNWEIEYTPIGNMGKVTLTVLVGEKPTKVFTMNILEEAAREKALAKLKEEFPPLAQPETFSALTEKLLSFAAEVAATLSLKTSVTGAQGGSPASKSSAELLSEMPETTRREAEAMLEDPDLIRRILEDIFALGVAGEQELVATIYLTGTSRLLDRPLAAIVQGTSSSGKSFPIRKVAGVFPPETVLHATQMSPQALFYMEPGSLRHKFVVAGERSRLQRDEAAEATRALREMISEGCLDKRVSMKVAGTIRTIHLHQEGPIAYVESTTQTSIFAEDANRALLLQTDESSAQTRRVLRKVASTYGENIGGCEAENIITRHWAAQRMLRSYAVCIPYAERLAALFPDQRVEARRAVGHIMNMIAAVALLHQRQRETDPDGRLVATGEDFQIARRLLDHPMARLVGRRISNAALRFRDRLEGWASGGNFSTRDATQKENATDRSVRGWLGELHRAGYMELVAEPRGKEPAIWRLAPQGPSEHVSILPTVAELFPELPDSLSGSAHDLAMKDVAPEIDVSSG